MANQVLYGFHNLKDVFDRRIDEVGVPIVGDAVERAVAAYNEEINQMLNLFVERTTDFKRRFKSAVAARLQPLDENGRARPIKGFGYYDVSFPIQMAGNAWGVNYVASKKMTVMDANNATQTMILSDANWIRDHLLAGLLGKDAWTFPDDDHGDLTIKPLANNDTDQFMLATGAEAKSTDNHYLAQAADIADVSNPFPTIYKKLTSRPVNSGEVIVFVATNLVDDIEDLADFKERPDPNIREGANASVLVGSLGAAIPGRIVGYVNKCWIVEWDKMPDNYMLATTTGGDKPLAMREDEEPVLRGFKKVAERNDHPFYESQYLRRAGFGAWNRVGAVAYRIGNASYATPTGFSSPMA